MKRVVTIAVLVALTQLTGCTAALKYRAEQIHRVECFQSLAHQGQTVQAEADGTVTLLDDDFRDQCKAEGII
ncbi:hypothetical protein [Photobacterium rosenbergii]|uniref:hypothetical protein n=1 Tax=Photobacterium rosenbergii TaxID=294936 RepID=UPI001C995FDC|nr:hypothetical protein [Photobacterium rosenbergii]MBY5944774.1 hypothetical protein [Photobacterium rosenbergii]